MIADGNIETEKPPTFERIDEYKALLDNLAGASLSRQNMNNIFIGLNTVALTALGFFISGHFNLAMWSTAIAVAIVTLTVMPVNFIWIITLTRYGQRAKQNYEYLREIEREFRERRGSSSGRPEIGWFLRVESLGVSRYGHTQLERILARYFFFFYPVICLILVVLTWLVQNHIIPPLSL